MSKGLGRTYWVISDDFRVTQVQLYGTSPRALQDDAGRYRVLGKDAFVAHADALSMCSQLVEEHIESLTRHREIINIVKRQVIEQGEPMTYVEAPTYHDDSTGRAKKKVFLAGGITDCPDWQADVTGLLKDSYCVVFNPRRENFPINDPASAPVQIKWEFDHLEKADIILFWFPKGPIQPIALFELGRWSYLHRNKTIAVGCDPDYSRELDIDEQMKLLGLQVHKTLKDTVDSIMWRLT